MISFSTSRLVGISLSMIVAALIASGCHNDHSHGSAENVHQEHGHHAETEGAPAQSVTVWTDRTELFMEYEPLIIGKQSRFAAHVTVLKNFKASTSGTLRLRLGMDDGTVLMARADKPSSPGIYRLSITPKKVGQGSFVLVYESGDTTDTIRGGPCEVFADEETARAALGDTDNGGGIGFTKEQQWKTDFATAPVEEHALQPSVRATGEFKPVSGKEARLTAPARGRVTIASPVPVPGMQVRKKQLLATVSPYLAVGGDKATLEAEHQAAKAELQAAHSQLARAERLFKEQAVPERRVEEARSRLSIARARLKAASGRLKQYNAGAAGMSGRSRGAFQVRSSLDGTLVEANVANGESVKEGKLLFTVMDLSRVWLVAKVFEPDIPRVESAKAAWFTVEGYKGVFSIDESNGRMITVGHVIDPKSRTVPVIFERENPHGHFRIGQFAEVFIGTGSLRKVLAVPESAILDDGGKSVVFVQAEGETFERRVLGTGIRDKGWVEVKEGLKEGERVVTRGAYEIRLAAASGAIPQHGHVH